MAESLMEKKERYRWSYMTENQLVTRLKRITNPEKLRCFMELAAENGNGLLLHLAQEQARLQGGPYLTSAVVPKLPQRKTKMRRLLKKKKVKKVNTGSLEGEGTSSLPGFNPPMPMAGDMNRGKDKRKIEKERTKKKAEDNMRTILI